MAFSQRLRLLPAVSLATALSSWSCGPNPADVHEAIFSFAEAVQVEDLDRLACLLPGATGGEEFDAWARSRYDDYLEGRDAGEVDLSDDGVVLVKAFALGKGTFFSVESVRNRGGALEVLTSVRFGYDQIDLSGFVPGTTFYLCGTPAGTVHPVRIPYRPGDVTVEVLDTITVRWSLVPAPPESGCAVPWQVASAEPVPDSETTNVVTWRF